MHATIWCNNARSRREATRLTQPGVVKNRPRNSTKKKSGPEEESSQQITTGAYSSNISYPHANKKKSCWMFACYDKCKTISAIYPLRIISLALPTFLPHIGSRQLILRLSPGARNSAQCQCRSHTWKKSTWIGQERQWVIRGNNQRSKEGGDDVVGVLPKHGYLYIPKYLCRFVFASCQQQQEQPPSWTAIYNIDIHPPIHSNNSYNWLIVTRSTCSHLSWIISRFFWHAPLK